MSEWLALLAVAFALGAVAAWLSDWLSVQPWAERLADKIFRL